MADNSSCIYSKREIVEAGKLLSRPISASEARCAEVLNAFKIARSWREANAYPMRRVRMEMVGKARSICRRDGQFQAITAARLKRMVSIRKKLRETYFTLYQMQDLGGCRAIVNDMGQLRALLVPYLEEKPRYSIVKDYDHIAEPKNDGYRSRHLVLKFSDDDNQGFNRHFVEVQFRTRQQHAWATAVEAVGLVRGEDLKGGRGDADWLRLFQIMATEIAIDEGCPPVEGVSDVRSERRRELAELDVKLAAVLSLDSYNRAIKHTEAMYSFSAPYYLIVYDLGQMKVEVRPFNFASKGSLEYNVAEQNEGANTVLVEVDKVADLREAYPNYFLDVGAFTRRLKLALRDDRIPTIDADWLAKFARYAAGRQR